MTATDPRPAVQPAAVSEVPFAPAAARRRRVTLAVLWAVFALWVASLLTMYFATVYPQRHPKDARPAAVAVPDR